MKNWPESAVRLRVLPAFTGEDKHAGQTFFVDPGTAEFSVYLPTGTVGEAVIEGMVEDGAGCYVAGQIARADFAEQPSIQRIELALTPYTRKQCAWSPRQPPPANALNRVWTDRTDNAWAVGADRTVVRWNGSRWFLVDEAIGEHLNGLWGSRTGVIWVVGVNGLIRRWNGSAFEDVASGTTAVLNGIWGHADSDIWAVGWSPTTVRGTLLRWNGAAWLNVPSDTTFSLISVWGAGQNDVWIVGEKGIILYWDGSNLSAETPPKPADAADWSSKSFQDVFGIDKDHIWITTAGTNGHILRRTQGTWTEALDGSPKPTRYVGSLYGGWVFDANTGWAVGDQGVRPWDGNAWGDMQIPMFTFRGIAGVSPKEIWAVGQHYAIPNAISTIFRWNGSRWREYPNF